MSEEQIDIEHFKLGDGISITIPKNNQKFYWERTKKVMDVLVGNEKEKESEKS